MNRAANRLMDDLYDMSETEFEHVYEMTKRAACVKFDIEGYTVGYQDAWSGRSADNRFRSALERKHYDEGFAEATRKRQAHPFIKLLEGRPV
jgi:hypothetical protein